MNQESKKNNPFFDFAMKYYEIGFSVFPTATDNAKVPAYGITDWQLFCERRATGAQIESWLGSAKKGHNITLACGRASNIIVLDWDSEDPALNRIAKEVLPPSPFEKLGKSQQPGMTRRWSRFYKYSEELSRYVKSKLQSPEKKKAGIWELLTNGKHSVLPPSYHPEGGEYQWAGPNPLDQGLDAVGSLTLQDLVNLDEMLEAYLSKDQIKGRHDHLIQYLFRKMESFKSMDEAKEKLIYLDRLVFSGNSYLSDPKESNGKTTEEFAQYLIESVGKSITEKKKSRGEPLAAPTIDPNAVGSERFFRQHLDKKGNITWKPAYRALGEWVKGQGILITSGSGDYKYKNGYWRFVSNEEIRSDLRDLTNPMCDDPRQLDLFLKDVRSACQTIKREFEPIANKVNLDNGVFDILTKEIQPSSNKFFFTYKVPYRYDPYAQCPKWIKFLEEVLGNQIQIDNAQKAFGYVLLGGKPTLEKAFFLIGDGRNGKGVFLNVLKRLVGDQNFSALSLKDITEKFTAIMLKDKILNISEEMGQARLESDIFKKVVSGEEIVASYKGRDTIKFIPTVRLFFASNHRPVFKDSSPKFLDRFHFFNFDTYIPEKKRDPYLVDKLYKELPGIFNWSLLGAHKVVAGELFVSSERAEELGEETKMDMDIVYAWFKECIEISAAGRVLTSMQIFNEFEAFVENGNFYPHFDKRWVMRCFTSHYKEACEKNGLDYSSDSRSYIEGKRYRIYLYIVVKKSYRPNDGPDFDIFFPPTQ